VEQIGIPYYTNPPYLSSFSPFSTTASALLSASLLAFPTPELIPLPLLPSPPVLLILCNLRLVRLLALLLLQSSLLHLLVTQKLHLLHQPASLLLIAVGDDRALGNIALLLLRLHLHDLRLERQLGLQLARHTQRVEVAFLALDVAVCRVLVLGRRDVHVRAHLAGQAHAAPVVGVAALEQVGDGVVEAVRAHGVPGAQEDDVAHEDLVFEGCTVMAFGLAEGFLDLTPDAGDGADGGAFELGDFERRAEHVLDECRVLEDFVWVAGKLELLDNLGAFVDVENNTSGGEAEARVLVRE